MRRRLAGAAPAHLPVEDGAPGEARHHQVDDLRAVEAGVEHVHADQDLRELLLLEAPDDGAGVRGGAASIRIFGGANLIACSAPAIGFWWIDYLYESFTMK